MATPVRTRIEPEAPSQPTLFLAFELGQSKWKLDFTIGMAQQPRERTIPAGDVARLQQEITRAKQRFGLPEDAHVMSCYEAGRDGCWLHRYLVAPHVENLVIDSANIEVNRRQRRAKTERLDVRKLVTMLLRHRTGERKVWSVVRVPSVEEEDRRQLHRDMLTAKQDRTRVINRIKGLLAGHGVQLTLQGDVEAQLDKVHQWDGSPLPSALLSRLKRAWQQVGFLTAHIQTLEAERRALLRHRADPVIGQVRQLFTLRGIGVNSAWLYWVLGGSTADTDRRSFGATGPTRHEASSTQHVQSPKREKRCAVAQVRREFAEQGCGPSARERGGAQYTGGGDNPKASEARKRNKKVALKHGFKDARELILAWNGWRVCASASPLGGQCHCSSPRVLHS